MADRRSDDTPLAPRRSLGAASSEGQSGSSEPRRPLSDRVSAAIATASTAGKSAAQSGAPNRSEHSRSKHAEGPREPAKSGRSDSRPPRTRKARLRMTHIDPWSVMKTAFLLSIAFGIVTVVAVAVVWSVLGAAGVWDSINKTVADVIGGESGSSFDVETYVGTSRVMGFTMIVAVLDVILITAVATLGAFLYNLAATLLGGIEVTLAEDDR